MRSYSYAWKASIDRETLPVLQEIAGKLGYIVDVPGGNFGNPSPPAFLDALAAAYQRDPAGLLAALRAAGAASQQPEPQQQ
jgi:hypothetical protein